jgi:hypothetical protein
MHFHAQGINVAANLGLIVKHIAAVRLTKIKTSSAAIVKIRTVLKLL